MTAELHVCTNWYKLLKKYESTKSTKLIRLFSEARQGPILRILLQGYMPYTQTVVVYIQKLNKLLYITYICTPGTFTLLLLAVVPGSRSYNTSIYCESGALHHVDYLVSTPPAELGPLKSSSCWRSTI